MKGSQIINSSYGRLDDFINKQTQLTEVTNEVYLTAGGYYQECYIAIFEELTSTDDSIRVDNESAEANVVFIAELFVKELLKKFPDKKFPFNKILSVTLPSQIIAKAIEQNLKKNTTIEYYANNNEAEYSTELPKLIRLASYYSFFEEVQLKNIGEGDKVLIVNDVISTGKLIEDIHNNISSIGKKNNRQARISCVLSVVDSRVPDKRINIEQHRKSIFFSSELSENLFISLAKREIIKYNKNPNPSKTLVRINPILNARITISSRHSEDNKIALKSSREFLKKIPLEAMVIGHFTQNSKHHPYFIKPKELFDTKKNDINSGVNLLKNIYKEIAIKEGKYDIDFYEKSISLKLESLVQLGIDNDFINNVKKSIKKEIKKYYDEVKEGNLYPSAKFEILSQDDYVFYPVFSGIEDLDINHIHDLFKINFSNILPLQRFDTNKGWRFIIPQKSLNLRLKGKKALIIDMGSFTGDSIIQMIDALCVFELKKIIVISLIGRLEDFDREFFSRIREMKVKLLNPSSNPSILSDEIKEITLAPVNIYFGTNLHIPPSQSEKLCEHCQEIRTLEDYKQSKEYKSTSVTNYIEERLNQININHVSEIKDRCPTYFPKLHNGTFDVLRFFTIRDHLGKIDGYRFYTDYYYYFDKLTTVSKNFDKDMEAIIAICLHENHLLTTVKNQLPDIYNNLQVYINKIINNNKIDSLKYRWKKKELLKFHLIINESKLLNSGLNQILDFIEDCSTCKEQLLFFIWEKHFEYRKEISKKFSIYEFRDNVFEAKKNIKANQESLLTEIFRICEQFNYNAKTIIDLSFFQLRRFFISESSLNNQYEANGNRIISHPSIYNDVNTTKIPLNLCLRDLENFENYISQFKNEWLEKEKLLFTELIEPLSNIKHFIISCDIRSKFLFIRDNSPDNIENLITQINSIVGNTSKANVAENVIQLRNCIDSIMDKYLNISSEFAKYCMRFFCNPISILNDFLNSADLSSYGITIDKIKPHFKDVLDIDKHYQVNIHADIISAVFKEVFTNYSKYGNSSNLDIDGLISDNSLVIKFKQFSFSTPNDKSETDDSNKVCLSNLVNGLLDGFGVKFYISFDNSGKAFIIQIEIPIYKTVNYGSNK